MEAVVEYNYVAQESDELTIRKGDIIKDVRVHLGGWWEGTLKDRRGMFPDNFVKVIETSGSARNSTGSGEGSAVVKCEEVTLRNGSGRKTCRVLFSYEPCKEDELKLVPDEVIEFLGDVEEGWWRGRIRGRIGVFPSNFVSPPMPDEPMKHKDRDRKEFCRVLFPYEASNEDELTLVEGDVITLLSRDAPDKGWWKGELNGQIGLFPDNFVEVMTVKTEHPSPESNLLPNKASSIKHQVKRNEKAHVRKSLDARSIRTDSLDKKLTPSSSSTTSSTSVMGHGAGDKKQTIISSLKRLVGDASNSNNGNGNVGIGLVEELDEVERGEGAPLSHLTASRARAPRRRLPSTQHLRHHVVTGTSSSTVVGTSITSLDDNMMNGNSENVMETHREDEGDGSVGKARKKAPWVEELKLNQMERKKIGSDRIDKPEVKKDRPFSWLPSANTDVTVKLSTDQDESKHKDKEKTFQVEQMPHVQNPSTLPAANAPTFVSYHLYSQLLERVASLEEKQIALQRTVTLLSEQLAKTNQIAKTSVKE